LLLLLLLSWCALTSTSARAQETQPETQPQSAPVTERRAPPRRPLISIGDLTVVTSQDDVGPAEVQYFQSQLLKRGYQMESCQERMDALARFAHPRIGVDAVGRDDAVQAAQHALAKRARIISSLYCETPDPDALVYEVVLTLDVDKVLKNRRANILFKALGQGHDVTGGYAHKPGETLEWNSVIDRAIERTLGGVNDPTSLRVAVPKETTVGDTVRLDGSKSWDHDGDSFELVFDVTKPACVPLDTTDKALPNVSLPLDAHPCPHGMKRGDVNVFQQVGEHDATLEFRTPQIGDYEVRVHARVSGHDEPAGIYRLRAYPRRSNTFFSRIDVLRLPKNFLRSADVQDESLLIGFGYVHRFLHRIGFFGMYEDAYLGLSLGSLQALSTFNLEARATGTLLGIEALTRTMDRSGRFGLVTPITLSALALLSDRDGVPTTEWGFEAKTMVGGYVAFGENYLDRPSSFCGGVCPSLTAGPTVSALSNLTTHKFGLVLGLELLMGVEF